MGKRKKKKKKKKENMKNNGKKKQTAYFQDWTYSTKLKIAPLSLRYKIQACIMTDS